MCRKNSNNWVKLDNVAYLKSGDETYSSNVVTVYNVPYNFIECGQYIEECEYDNLKEIINVCISDGVIYYNKKIIKSCKFGFRVYRKIYVITPKGIF